MTTNVVVQGEPSPSYKWGRIGTKLDRVVSERRRGHLIYVITEAELRQLLTGKALTRAQSAIAAGSALSPMGVQYRPPATQGVGSSTAYASLLVDLNERDQRLREHCRLTDMAAEVLDKAGLVPLSPVGPECAYDLAWIGDRTFQVLEVKTTRVDSEVQQIRLGLGQVLEYRTWLRSHGVTRRTEAHLLISTEPQCHRAVAACEASGVSVWWPERLHLLSSSPRHARTGARARVR